MRIQNYFMIFILVMGCCLIASQAHAYMIPMYALSGLVDNPHPDSIPMKAPMLLEEESYPEQTIHTIPDPVQPGIMILFGLIMICLAKLKRKPLDEDNHSYRRASMGLTREAL